MLTEIGLNRVKNAVKKMAQRDDAEVNAILQTAIIELNRLKIKRYGTQVNEASPSSLRTK